MQRFLQRAEPHGAFTLVQAMARLRVGDQAGSSACRRIDRTYMRTLHESKAWNSYDPIPATSYNKRTTSCERTTSLPETIAIVLDSPMHILSGALSYPVTC